MSVDALYCATWIRVEFAVFAVQTFDVRVVRGRVIVVVFALNSIGHEAFVTCKLIEKNTDNGVK